VNRVLKILTALNIAAWACVAISLEADAQTPPPPVGVSSSITFDQAESPVGGAALKDAVIALFPPVVVNPSGVIAIKTITAPLVVGANSVSATVLFTGQPAGVYKVAVQARDAVNNTSAWAMSEPFTLTSTGPLAPTNVKVVITIQASN
jgi:hypothetical protein